MLHHGLASYKHPTGLDETPNASCAQAYCLAELGATTAFATAHFLKFLNFSSGAFVSKQGRSMSRFN
jgi:hypothetical protein